jgi:hypothetical protein
MLLEGLIPIGRRRRRGLLSIERRVESVRMLVEDLRRALEHRQSELDRRLAAIEAGVARAENEARMLPDRLVRSTPGDPS